MAEKVKEELIKQGVLKAKRIYISSDDVRALQYQGITVYSEPTSDGSLKYFFNRIDEDLSNNDLMELIMLETMKATRETAKIAQENKEVVKEIRTIAKFFYVLGIISIFVAVFCLFAALAALMPE